MKKIKKSKKGEIENLFSSFQRLIENRKNHLDVSSKLQEIFSHRFDLLNNHFLESNFFSQIKPPEPPEKFHYMNCKASKIPKDQIYDQV